MPCVYLEKLSIGLNGKFAYSNLTGGLTVGGVNTKPGVVGAADLSFTYYNDDAKIGNIDGVYTFATTFNNIGNKVAYSELATRDFIPMNLKIGNSFLANFDAYNKVTFSLDLQKLLVPTPPNYYFDGEDYILTSGMNPDVGVINGMLQSFMMLQETSLLMIMMFQLQMQMVTMRWSKALSFVKNYPKLISPLVLNGGIMMFLLFVVVSFF